MGRFRGVLDNDLRNSVSCDAARSMATRRNMNKVGPDIVKVRLELQPTRRKLRLL